MHEYPAEAGGIALGVFGSSNGVKGEANAQKPPDRPVRDSVAAEVEESPSQ